MSNQKKSRYPSEIQKYIDMLVAALPGQVDGFLIETEHQIAIKRTLLAAYQTLRAITPPATVPLMEKAKAHLTLVISKEA